MLCVFLSVIFLPMRCRRRWWCVLDVYSSCEYFENRVHQSIKIVSSDIIFKNKVTCIRLVTTSNSQNLTIMVCVPVCVIFWLFISSISIYLLLSSLVPICCCCSINLMVFSFTKTRQDTISIDFHLLLSAFNLFIAFIMPLILQPPLQ